ncbi:MAG: aldo/keto reductase [Alphaproteobacteria bacterium]|nr:aldo/keto reductase [Alphaproteobacteria bacterium]
MEPEARLSRRRLLRAASAAAVVGGAGSAVAPAPVGAQLAGAQLRRVASRPIKPGGEAVPVVGLGSWITFNVGNDRQGRDACAEVMRAFFASGGRMIDSSPMYGSSQAVIGAGLKKLGMPGVLFAATKVWTASGASGPAQIEESRLLWGVEKFDLLQVHNILAWEKHLETLRAMKAAGRVRYIGVTTSHGMRHAEIERIMATQPIDFVQVTYNVADREVEQRILPLAAEKGMAVIANRPFREGALIEELKNRKLPDFAAEIDCAGWPQFLLKFIVSHPAITCAIPATSRVDHVVENMGAALGRAPDPAMRQRMAAYVRGL